MRSVIALSLLLLLGACAADSERSDGSFVAPPSSASAAFNGGPAYAPGGADGQARSSFAQGDIEGAQAGFENVLGVNSFDPVALNNLAVAKTEAGQYNEALDLLQRAEKLAPQNTEIAANLARLRSWSQTYTLDDGSVIGQAGSLPDRGFRNLPPEPPPLWDTRTQR